MDANKTNLTNLFQRNGARKFTVPFYQRGYVWGSSQDDNGEYTLLSRFVDDMEDVLTCSGQYFVGSVILKKMPQTSNTEEFLIVDGQQRMTTFAIYLKLLSQGNTTTETKFNRYFTSQGESTATLNLSKDDEAIFHEIMMLDVPTPANKIRTHTKGNILHAYEYLKNRVDKYEGSKSDLFDAILDNVCLIEIKLESSDNEQRIFDSINSLGADLTTDELLKNFLYQSGDYDKYVQQWYPVFETQEALDFWGTDAAKSRQSKSREKSTVNRLFHAYVCGKMWSLPLTPAQQKNFVKPDNVYSACQAFVNLFGMTHQQLAAEIVEYAAIYKNTFNQDILDTRLTCNAGIKRIAFFMMSTNTWTPLPYVMYVLKNITDPQTQNKIFETLEAYLVRRCIWGAKTSNYSQMFAQDLINGKHFDAQSLTTYFDQRDERSTLRPSNAQLCNPIGISETNALAMLYMWETKLPNNTDFNNAFSSCNSHALMPTPSTKDHSDWAPLATKEEEDQRKLLQKTMGNVFMMVNSDKTLLKKVKNDSFAKKKSAMSNYMENIKSSQNLRDHITRWNMESIQERNNTIAQAVSKLWP